MLELTFNKAIEFLRKKVYKREYDQDYKDAVNTIVYLWDQHRVNLLNRAVLLKEDYDKVGGGELYLIWSVRPLRYLIIRRDKTWTLTN